MTKVDLCMPLFCQHIYVIIFKVYHLVNSIFIFLLIVCGLQSRKYLAELFNSSRDNPYHPRRNWTLSVREHLNKSLGEEGLEREFRRSKPTSFLSHPIPECSCRILKPTEIASTTNKNKINHHLSYEGENVCPKWMYEGVKTVSYQKNPANESESLEDELDFEEQLELSNGGSTTVTTPLLEQDEEMDPND